MTADEVKAALAKAARRCWPDVKKASDLPFPDYWKAVTEWLTFHAPHIGDALLWKLIDDFAVSAKEAEERGLAPIAPRVSDEVKEIWSRVDPPSPLANARSVGGNASVGTGARSVGDKAAPKPPSPFGAPFSGPRPGALKRTKRMMQQGSLGSW